MPFDADATACLICHSGDRPIRTTKVDPGARHAWRVEGSSQSMDHSATATLEGEGSAGGTRIREGGLASSSWVEASRCTAISPGFSVRRSLWGLRRTHVEGGRATTAGELHYVRCPRCGSEIAREMLERHWNEWGVICYCQGLGTFDPGCHVFDDPPRGRSAAADPGACAGVAER